LTSISRHLTMLAFTSMGKIKNKTNRAVKKVTARSLVSRATSSSVKKVTLKEQVLNEFTKRRSVLNAMHRIKLKTS
jgi:hypothetical protein